MVRAVKHIPRPIIALAFLTLAASASPAPEADRAAIRSMAGSFDVSFDFQETAAISPDYPELAAPYTANAREIVVIAEETDTRITLQHLLVVGKHDGKPTIIKHWAQVWTWEDRVILDFTGGGEDPVWNKITLTESEAKGTWSQLVTQVDDTPRYENIGRWIHENGESCWTSEPTRRPLPRRDYTKRDDYDYLTVTNHHILTTDGWLHKQDNRKVVDRDGKPATVLCHESGLNHYTRSSFPETRTAVTWWRENQPFWDHVRNFWIDAGEAAQGTFAYRDHANGMSLRKRLRQMEDANPPASTITGTLTHYLSIH